MKSISGIPIGVFFALLTLTSGQAQVQFCGFDETQQGPFTQIGGADITATGTVKALLIFIDFSDDTQSPTDPEWPTGGGGPTYLGQIVDLTETQNSGEHYNLTTFFRDVSFDQFTMIGQAFYRQAPYPLSTYILDHQGEEAAYATRDVINLLDAEVDFADFDRWTYIADYNHTLGPDGRIDMVFACFRRWYDADGFFALGWYSLSLPDENPPFGPDPVPVDGGSRFIHSNQGVDVTEMIQYPRLDIPLHEFGHVWDLRHNYSGGLWALMGNSGSPGPNVSYFMNSYERERLGWMTFTDITVNGTNATIADFGTNGVAYRLTIPGTSEYFLVENHQLLSEYDKVEVNVVAPGLYILQNTNTYDNNVRVVAADGRWVWTTPYWIDNPYAQGDLLPVFERHGISRALGHTDKVLIPVTGEIPPGEASSDLMNVWLDECTGDEELGPRYKDDGKDVFTYASNRVFSPWSAYAAYNWSGTTQTTLGLEITGTSGSNIITKFYTTTPASASPAKPPLGWDPRDIGPYQYGWVYLAWDAGLWDGLPIEPDVNWSELQRKIGAGSWVTVYSGPNRVWSDGSIVYDPDGGTPVYFRVRVRDNQNKWSLWSDEWCTYRRFIQGKIPAADNPGQKPSSFGLSQNYPNPFNPSTSIKYDLPFDSRVSLKVYDVLGKEVLSLVDGVEQAGYHEVSLDASSLASGIYFYRLIAGSFTDVKKLTILK